MGNRAPPAPHAFHAFGYRQSATSTNNMCEWALSSPGCRCAAEAHHALLAHFAHTAPQVTVHTNGRIRLTVTLSRRKLDFVLVVRRVVSD
jgi:hypothetical protein